MEQSYPTPDQDYTVLIISYTYNQENYIEETLKGFVMQKTNFPFVALVIDDASTDKTADVIRQYEVEYPNVIKGIYLRENHYSKGKSKDPYINPWRNRCKYEALCEGDDYWIDPLKLQKQVDFLDENPEYGMVYGKVKVYHQEKRKYEGLFGKSFNNIKSLFVSNPIPTLSVLIRMDMMNNYNKEIGCSNKWLLGDYPLWLYISIYSKVGFIDSVLGVYRVLLNSASHNVDYKKKFNFVKSVYDMKLFFANKYGIASVTEVEHLKYSSFCSTAIMYNQINDATLYYNKLTSPSINLSIKYWLCRFHAKWLIELAQKIIS